MCVCMVRADSQPCLVSLRYARKMKLSGSSTFKPKCRADGSYAPVQCHRDTGCWCVTPQGKSLPNTSVRNGRPKCRRGIVYPLFQILIRSRNVLESGFLYTALWSLSDNGVCSSIRCRDDSDSYNYDCYINGVCRN